jgi:PAS domain S-box-containing protein
MTEHRPYDGSLHDRERLRLLLEQMPGILWSVDRELRFTSSMGAALSALGLEANQVVGMSLFENFRTDDIDFPPIAAHRWALNGQVSSLETTWDERTFEVHIEPFRDAGGGIQGAIGVAFDVTEGKRAEVALRESERRYRTLFEESKDAIYVSATDGTLVDFNKSMLTLFGYTREEMEMLNAEEMYVHASDRHEFRQVIEREGGVSNYEVQLVGKDGTVMDCLLSSTVQPGEDGEILGYQGIIRDITHRKQAQDKLRKEKEFSDAAIGSLPGLFYMLDEQGKFVRWNKNVERVSGYSASELSNLDPFEFFIGEDRQAIIDAVKEVFEKGSSTVEVDLVAKDGSRKPYFFTGKAVILDGKRCLVGMAISLDERRRLERQLRQSQKMEAVGRLAGGIAHDFNNILTIILSNTEFLLKDCRSPDTNHEELMEIRSAAERAASLTGQLLAFSRKQVLQARVLNLNDVVVNVEKMLRRLIGEDIELVTMLTSSLWSVEADPGQLEQIIMNLAVNARDAMPSGGRLSIQSGNVELDTDFAKTHYPIVPGRYVMLAVSDNGIGMDADTHSRIFEPFFTTKQRGQGTGLGLSTVYGIVKQSGGYIWAYSEPGQGTTFEIYLPRVEKTAERLKSATAAAPHVTGSEVVLLVEDERLVRALARRILEGGGYTVLEADGAREAIDISGHHQGGIDLLLTDVVMPEVNGPELAERLAGERPDMQVLYMSGYTDHAALRQGVWEADASLIQKPFSPDSLLRKVQEVLSPRELAG